MQLIGKVLGDPNKKEIRILQPTIDQINALEPEMERLSDEEMAAKTEELGTRLALARHSIHKIPRSKRVSIVVTDMGRLKNGVRY